ncbi:MAG: hypothetical protein Q7U55_00625 [Deltaproteobacteria bacterium]|jgi:hypothetical protein|nr:hypothetical protein [Deltaproteobacteria bacterium]
MGVKNIYERFVWFDNQVRAKKYPNTTTLAEQFEISTKTAQRDIDMKEDAIDDTFSFQMVEYSPTATRCSTRIRK